MDDIETGSELRVADRSHPPAAIPARSVQVDVVSAARTRAKVRRVCALAQRVLAVALFSLACCGPGRAWNADRMLAQAQRFGPAAVLGVQALQPLITSIGELEEGARLLPVNQFYNRRILFRDDSDVWGVADHWASPLEMLGKGAGDCEDYAIAKYFTLAASGIPVSRMRLVYVRAQLGGPGGVVQPHMVLAYYPAPTAEPLILDNLIEDVRPASRRPDLAPVFSFNSDGLWQGVTGASDGDPVARLSRWREVLSKARAEGFL
jgi:predicted transglutaminase-like cysteine proteinase